MATSATTPRDTLVLEGRVPNQTALVRILVLPRSSLPARRSPPPTFACWPTKPGRSPIQAQTQTQPLRRSSEAARPRRSLAARRGSQLTNQIRTNLGRAKAIEAAGGRILSFIEVSDLPQVRVDIRLVEVNRTKLRTFNPNTVVARLDFRQPSLNPAQSAATVQGDQAARVGSAGAAIQNVLSFLNGGLLNELQYAGGNCGDRRGVVAARA